MRGTFSFKLGNFDVFEPVIQKMIDDSIDEHSEELDAKYDDTKVFPTFNDFPAIGLPDVLYIDDSTGTQYTWVNGEYKALIETISNEDIVDIVS